MPYEIKDDRRGFIEVLKNVLRRLIKIMVYLVLFLGFLYGVFYFLYVKFPGAQRAVDQVIQFFYSIYEKYGLWAVLGAIVFVIAAIWALADELNRKERRKDMMRDMMK